MCGGTYIHIDVYIYVYVPPYICLYIYIVRRYSSVEFKDRF